MGAVLRLADPEQVRRRLLHALELWWQVPYTAYHDDDIPVMHVLVSELTKIVPAEWLSRSDWPEGVRQSAAAFVRAARLSRGDHAVLILLVDGLGAALRLLAPTEQKTGAR